MSKSKEFIYERMERLPWGIANQGKVRLWIKSLSLKDPVYLDVRSRVSDFMAFNPRTDAGDMANMIAHKFEDELAAVEVTDMHGNGLVIYIDWP